MIVFEPAFNDNYNIWFYGEQVSSELFDGMCFSDASWVEKKD